MTTLSQTKLRLLSSATLLLLPAAPAFAQSQPGSAQPQNSTTAAQSAVADQSIANGAPQAAPTDTGSDIVVTGTLVRNPAAATASPVVSITADDVTKRGITSTADLIQTLPANNQGTAPPSWSQFGFASGASAPSLRGLDDAYTLTLFNGMRSAPYPLGDDGYRNFVDLNTIPSSIIDRVDVLQDGASATYGSDAIAGVVNVIIKRNVQGVHLNASTGISQRGYGADSTVSLTAGYGDLNTQHFNVYVNGEYQRQTGDYTRDRGGAYSIYGTDDQSSICDAAGSCLANTIRNGIQAGGGYNGLQATPVPFVRPYAADANGIPGASLGGYQFLNPAAGCQNFPSVTLTAAQRSVSGTSNGATIVPATVCQYDATNLYKNYAVPTERKGANIVGTVKLGDSIEAYAMFNYYNTTTSNVANPVTYTGQTAPGGTRVTVSAIYLPVYVCSAGVSQVTGNNLYATGCTAANGTLNPNNPYAAQGQVARLVSAGQVDRDFLNDTKTYRFSAGVNGSFGDGFNFNLAGTASEVVLNRINTGQLLLQGLEDAIAKGTYNFVNPSANSEATTQQVFPTSFNRSVSKLTQIMATMDKDLFTLPGGRVNLALSGQYRYEAIHNPSSNAPNNVNPAARYYGINGVGVDGKRNVWSTGYEVTMPVFNQLKLKAEGSYDHYSTGQGSFSPKFEAEFRPIEQIKFRGTYSKGFRIPSFSESFALPTTGFVSASIVCTNPTYTAFCAAHASNPSYYAGTYNYGLTSAGNPNLKPEKSTEFTLGTVIQPTRKITLTVDYYQIKLSNVIIPTTVTTALINQYYANNGVVNVQGLTVTPGLPDQQNPNALPLLGTVVGSYQNADGYLARGLDFSISATIPLGGGITLRSKADASRLLKLEQTNADGSVSRFDNSLGACNVTACSGAPRWRGVWSNTLDFNHNASVTLTANYTSGFSEVATDSGGIYGDCAASVAAGQIVAFPDGTPVQCFEKSTFYFDGHAEAKVKDNFTLYFDVKNILDTGPSYTPNANYNLYRFNAAWQDELFTGRYFRAGVKVDF